MKISGRVIKLLVIAGVQELHSYSSYPSAHQSCLLDPVRLSSALGAILWNLIMSMVACRAHRRGTCVDCHLPNENRGAHAVWKTISGLKDAAMFYSGRVPDHIKITAHGKEVLQANCIRCHETTVMFINHERQCWECHRRISHKRTGAMATL